MTMENDLVERLEREAAAISDTLSAPLVKEASARIQALEAELAQAHKERDAALDHDWVAAPAYAAKVTMCREFRARAERAEAELALVEDERDALLKAIGFKVGPFRDATMRKVILDDASGLRPEMVRARKMASDLQDQIDSARLAAIQGLREWVRKKFGPWITWRTATAAIDEITAARSALEGKTDV